MGTVQSHSASGAAIRKCGQSPVEGDEDDGPQMWLMRGLPCHGGVRSAEVVSMEVRSSKDSRRRWKDKAKPLKHLQVGILTWFKGGYVYRARGISTRTQVYGEALSAATCVSSRTQRRITARKQEGVPQPRKWVTKGYGGREVNSFNKQSSVLVMWILWSTPSRW